MIKKPNLLKVLAANGLSLDEDTISGYTCLFIGGLPDGCPELLFDEASGIVIGKLRGEALAPINNIKDLAFYFETCTVKTVPEKKISHLMLYNLAMEGFLDSVTTDLEGKVFGIPHEFVKDTSFSVTSVKEVKGGRIVLTQRSFMDFAYYFSPKVGGKVRWLPKKEWPCDSDTSSR